jgi:GH25 family lysozyme M1 (1,4-beta-N-acetylmuramidase)
MKLKGCLLEYPKWIADYSRCPEAIDWTIHQFSETGSLDGISEAVDLNFCQFPLLDSLMVANHD